MPRYIDADILRDKIDEWLDSVGSCTIGKGLSYYGELLGCIEDTPTADVEEVRHGEWIYQISDLFPADSTKECNQCHARQNLFCDDEYCPHCGAKMDGKEK